MRHLGFRRCGSGVEQPSGRRRDIHRVVWAWGCVNGGIRPPCPRPSSRQNEISRRGSVVGKNASFVDRKRHHQKGSVRLSEGSNRSYAALRSVTVLSQSVNIQTWVWISIFLCFYLPVANQQLPGMLLGGLIQREDPQHRHLSPHRLGEDHPYRANPLLHRQDSGDPRGKPAGIHFVLSRVCRAQHAWAASLSCV